LTGYVVDSETHISVDGRVAPIVVPNLKKDFLGRFLDLHEGPTR
jgi:hypothetical protein